MIFIYEAKVIFFFFLAQGGIVIAEWGGVSLRYTWMIDVGMSFLRAWRAVRKSCPACLFFGHRCGCTASVRVNNRCPGGFLWLFCTLIVRTRTFSPCMRNFERHGASRLQRCCTFWKKRVLLVNFEMWAGVSTSDGIFFVIMCQCEAKLLVCELEF